MIRGRQAAGCGLLVGFAGLACALQATAAEAVRTVHPSRDVVIAERVLRPGAGSGDSVRIQRAIEETARIGGGTVFLAAGTYRIDAPLTLRRGVTLRGDYAAARPAESTVLAIVHGEGDEEGTAALSLEHGSGLSGLVFHYPDQRLEAPKPYPWTVRTAIRSAGNNQTVEDCTFVNSWRAVCIGPEVNECHTFRRVRICALRTGFFVDMTTDIGRVSDVFISPACWLDGGFANTPDPARLVAFLRAGGAVGADYARSDWEFIRNLRVDNYHVGVRFRRGKDIGMNGVMAKCQIRNCDLAVAADEMNEVGLAVYDAVFAGNATNLVCSPKFDSVALFHSCVFDQAPLVLGPKGTVSLRDCGKEARVDASAGGRLMRDDAPAADRVAFETMAFARPKGDAVVFAEIDAKAADCTAAIQSALDAAGRKGSGATVYLPAGVYNCSGHLVVPAGVELRGASAVPHHTMSGGTVLFVRGGRGRGDAAPFCSLRPGSGLRGLSFWYPEQSVAAPVSYPWTVRSLGPGCWLTDVNIANAWQGVDFGSHPSDGHRISYLSGGFYSAGIRVANCASAGWVEDVQMNPHYVYRRPGDHPLTEPKESGRGEPAFILYQREHLTGLSFADCADERISGTFLYAARTGIVFSGRMNASVLIHGTDTGCRAFVLDTAKGSRVRGALVQLVALGAKEEGAYVTTRDNAGDLFAYASQFWPKMPLLVQDGCGRTVLDQFNAVAGPVLVRNGSAEVVSGFFRRRLDAHVVATPPAGVTCRGCVGERGKFLFEKKRQTK